MIENLVGALRLIAAEPPAPDPPRRVSRDWLILAVGIGGALLEFFLRTDLVDPLAWFAMTIGATAATLWRRSHPLPMVVAVFTMMVPLTVVSGLRHEEPTGMYSAALLLLLPFALGRWASGRHILIGLGVMLCQYGVSLVFDRQDVSDHIVGFFVFFLPVEFGAMVRYRVWRRERELDEVRLRERADLARDLHDTVAHHVSAIAVRAQAGRAVAAQTDDLAVASRVSLDALAVIEREASRTLTEMRAMVRTLRPDSDSHSVGPRDRGRNSGAQPSSAVDRWPGLLRLRGDGAVAPRAPQPGLADLAQLGDGLDGLVTLEIELTGELDGLGSGVQSTLFRVAQESITNAIKHAADATMVRVVVTGAPDEVSVTVTDDGRIAANHPEQWESGYGLRGMAERVSLMGGVFHAGPAPRPIEEPDSSRSAGGEATPGATQGWQVEAVLPLDGGAEGVEQEMEDQ